jgi:hypothetical protein
MDVLADAAIAGGSAAFATWLGTSFNPAALWVGFVAFGMAFFGSLGAARRRRPP